MLSLFTFVVGSVFLGVALTFKFILWLASATRPTEKSGVEGCFENLLVMLPFGIAVVLYCVAAISSS
ncbi:MAG: hypothetical protein U0350_33955 [Caldilineaceae bacterium]